MAGQRVIKLNRGSDKAKARRRRQLVVLRPAGGMFLAAALTSPTTAPTAHADPIVKMSTSRVHASPTVDPAPGNDGAGGHGGTGGKGKAGGAPGASGKHGTPG